MSRFLVRLAAGWVISALVAGCTLVQVRDQSQAFYEATVLVGRVTMADDAAAFGAAAPIVVAAIREESHRRTVAHRVRLHEAGGYELIVPNGSYTVVAFVDTNENGLPDSTEPAAVARTRVASEGLITSLDLSLRTSPRADALDEFPSAPLPPLTHCTQAGARLDFNSEAFSAEAGRQGLK